MMKYILNILFFMLLCHGFGLAQLTMKKHSDGIHIVDGDKDVLFYQMKPLAKDGSYERCNYIHPLWGLDGEVLTEDFPVDHMHHRGVFWAWHQVWIGDERIGDPWEIKDFDQEIIEVEFIKDKDQSAWLKSEVLWSSDKWRKDGEKIPYIRENISIHVHEGTMKYRRIDFKITLLALVDNLKIGGSEDEKGYGGFSVRMALPDDVKFSGKNGIITPEDTAVESDGFVNISGAIGKNGAKGGLVIADDKSNPGYPQPLILRAKNSMQNLVWPGAEPVEISKSKPLILRYSIIVYAGRMNPRRLSNILE